MDIAQIIAGFAVGAIVGITGVGGGALMTPILVLLFGVAPATAVGTDLLYAAITKSGGTLVHARRGAVEWRIVGLLAAGSLPAAALTLVLAAHFAPGGLGGASRLITGMLGVALLLTAAALIFRKRLLAWSESRGLDSLTAHRRASATVFTGALLGTLVSLSSVGAGALGVTALFFLYPGLAAVRIVGSDLAHAVPLALVAGLGHWWLGSVDWMLLGALLAGSLPGILVGSHLAHRIPERVLRPALAGMLALVGGKLILT
ncbi:MAG: sulfite exporter TauE/SafE family protein [Candidatus Nitricoxidivorans perseverans]|uniref:Probable membrane transporter protein n=1 Tax=Candidatus Nitricoxidivorans perseverans TaxID=2975601 RepID=A0AA49FN70_9PROT|nr:MAG: sulfite exporter TauE/SafE family protein [Candidatus Nitricoxidivorans perseverans]